VNDRTKAVVLSGALAVCLVAGSSPRVVGDGGEYLAQAMNFAAFNPPPLGRRAIATIEQRIQELEPVLAAWQIEDSTTAGTDRRRDFPHFWFYALLATPSLWIVEAVGASPLYAFTLTNLALALTAIGIALPRVGPTAVMLVFAGPLVWWLDKAHGEVFTVSLVTIALTLMRERPAWALVAAGAATSQNLPFGGLYGLIVLDGLIARRSAAFRDRVWVAGAALGGALVLLHPIYVYARHGTLTLQFAATRPGFPSAAEFSAIVTDPSIGLVGNAPFFLLAVAVALGTALTRPAMLRSPAAVVAVASGALFLYAAARTNNTHHGATPSLSRYALWLLPLAIPFFAAVRNQGGALARTALGALAVVSTATSVFAFHPAVTQNTREPTWLATWIWTHHPTRHNPLPEVFSATHLHVEGTTTPVATAKCEKILLAVPTGDAGAWPVPCYPADVPLHCLVPDAICYANRVGNAYRFVRAPGRETAPTVNVPGAWPKAAEVHVRRVFDYWGWWDLSTSESNVTIIREVANARAMTVGDNNRFVSVVRPRRAGATIRLRPQGVMTGELVDAATGEILQALRFTGAPGELWTIEIPADRPSQILALGIEAPK
jgi:hypothetical protein